MWPLMSKVCCNGAIGTPSASSSKASVVPSWGVHPSLKTALDSLQSYDRWVANVLMPIAFQWIEEHRDEVYDRVPKEPIDMTDDVGVVIAAAFSIIEKTPLYQKERELWETLYGKEQVREISAPICLQSGAHVNPIWEDIANTIQTDILNAFRKHQDVLGSTAPHLSGEPKD